MSQPSEDELRAIFAQINAGPGIWTPIYPAERPNSVEISGTVYCVYIRQSDITPDLADVERIYWDSLHQTPIEALRIIATINGVLSSQRSSEAKIHFGLSEKFVSPTLRGYVDGYRADGPPATAVVFNRVGCLAMMRHLILYGDRSEGASCEFNALGDLAVLANDFVDPNAEFQPSSSPTLNAVLALLPTWDIYNPRDVAYTMCRSFSILTEILPGSDPQVRELAVKAGIDPSNVMIDGIPMGDFIAGVFGLFAYGINANNPDRFVFDRLQVFSNVGLKPGILEAIVNAHARTMEQFADMFGEGNPPDFARFVEDLRKRTFLLDNLNIFRRFPLLRLDENRVLILDLQFLVELLTSGVYWYLFDSLPKAKRTRFRELWGRLFEVYAVGLLKGFYPPAAQVFAADVDFDGGQIDAILDMGDFAIVFEMKASLLTEPAKRGAKEADFIGDFRLKFLKNERGKPKGAGQLANSCRAVETGLVRTVSSRCKIFPVLVSDEPAVESAFFNTFLDEEFQKLVPKSQRIQPITVMSISELEGLLPYTSQNAISWPELLNFRFRGGTVRELSVHQAIYDISKAKGIPILRNDSMWSQFLEIGNLIRSCYSPAPVGAAQPSATVDDVAS